MCWIFKANQKLHTTVTKLSKGKNLLAKIISVLEGDSIKVQKQSLHQREKNLDVSVVGSSDSNRESDGQDSKVVPKILKDLIKNKSHQNLNMTAKNQPC